MKKALLFLTAVLLLFPLVSCETGSPKKPKDTEEDSSAAAVITGTTYDTGNFSVLVPDGWKEFPQNDLFSDEDPKPLNPNVIRIGKNCSTDYDLYSKPSIQINYAGPSTTLMQPDKSFYDRVRDLPDVATGKHKWTAFSGESMGTPLALLFESRGGIQFQATVWTGSGNETINLEDEDVKALLASVKMTNSADIEKAGGDPWEGLPDATPGEPVTGNEEADDSDTDFFRFRGDWNGAFALKNTTGKYDKGFSPDGAIARIKYAYGDFTVYIGICFDPTIENLTAKYDAGKDALLLTGDWNRTHFENVPMTLKNGTLTATIPIRNDQGSADIVINLRRLEDEGWTTEDPKFGASQLAQCKGKDFDALAEMLGISFMDYPSPDPGVK